MPGHRPRTARPPHPRFPWWRRRWFAVALSAIGTVAAVASLGWAIWGPADVVVSAGEPDGLLEPGSDHPLAQPEDCAREREPSPSSAAVAAPENVKVNLYVRPAAGGCWTLEHSPTSPGDHLSYLLRYENVSDDVQRDVAISLNLPPGVRLVPGTTTIVNGNHPDGRSAETNALDSGGIDIGNYNPGAVGYVIVDAALPPAGELQCGHTTFTTVGVARPIELNEHYNTAITHTLRTC